MWYKKWYFDKMLYRNNDVPMLVYGGMHPREK